MKKYLLSTLFLLVIGSLNAQQFKLTSTKSINHAEGSAREASATVMDISHCGKRVLDWGLNANESMSAAVGFSAETMAKYVGNQLTKVKIGIGNDTGIKNAKIFLSNNLEQEPFYTQEVTFTIDRWNEIALNTPYTIEEKDLFIGYVLTSGSNSRATQFSTDNEMAAKVNYISLPGQTGNNDWYVLSEAGIPHNFAIKGVLEGNSLPQYDFEFDYLTPQKGILEKGGKAALKGTLKSLGAQNITRFDIVYQAGEASPVTITKGNLNLNSTDRYDFTIDNIEVAPEKVTEITVTLNNFNGTGSEGPSIAPVKTSVLCPGESSVVRKVLMENFTTAQCPQCPAGHTTLKGLVKNYENIIWVAHHSGYYTDSYTIPESEEYIWFYNDGGATYAPAIMLDRAATTPQSGKTPVLSVSQSAVKQALEASLAAPAYTTVNIEREYDHSTRQLKLTVSGKALYGNFPGIARINVFLTENGIIGQQSGGSSRYEHNNVIRAVLTDTWGTPVTFDAEGNYTLTYNYTLNSKWKAENMSAVAFLGGYDSKNVMNCPVYNAESTFVYPEGSGINSSKADETIRVYAHNSQITIDGEFAHATIYDTTGKIVESLEAKKISSRVSGGVYIIKIIHKDQTIVKRVAVR